MRKYDINLDEFFRHPLYDLFQHWMIENGLWRKHWVWVESDRWHVYWQCFRAGAKAQCYTEMGRARELIEDWKGA